MTDIDNTPNQDAAIITAEKKPKSEKKDKLSLENLPDLLTVSEVAEILRVTPLTIKRWGKRGKLTPIRINSRGDRRYKKEAVLWMLGIAPSK